MYVMQYGLKSYKNISIIPFIFEIENEEIPNDLYAIALIFGRKKKFLSKYCGIISSPFLRSLPNLIFCNKIILFK